jgi:hypothetical protein
MTRNSLEIELEKLKAGTHVAVPAELLRELVWTAQRAASLSNFEDIEFEWAEDAGRAAQNVLSRHHKRWLAVREAAQDRPGRK